MNNPLQIFSQVKEFVKGLTPQSAEQQANAMLQSGQVSQEKFNQAVNAAKTIQKMLNGR